MRNIRCLAIVQVNKKFKNILFSYDTFMDVTTLYARTWPTISD